MKLELSTELRKMLKKSVQWAPNCYMKASE